MLMAVASWAGYTLIGRQVLKAMSPLKSTLWASIFGTLMLAFLRRVIWLILDESIAMSLLVGGSIAVIGILLVNRVPVK
jgi:drug/metabolite transporter (DMT)-like permease